MDKTFTVSRLVKVINFRTLNGTIYAHKNFLKTYSTLTYKTKSILLFNQILGKLRLRWKFPPISFNEWVWLQRRIFLSSIVWRRKASVLKLNNINQIYILYLKYYPHIYFHYRFFINWVTARQPSEPGCCQPTEKDTAFIRFNKLHKYYFNSHAVGMAAARSDGFKMNFSQNPFSRSAARFFL